MSESNQVQLRHVEESTYGTTPANSTLWKETGYTEESFGAEQDKRQSALVDNNRIVQDKVEVRRAANHSFGFELRGGWYDDLLEALYCGTWSTGNTLTVGTLDRSFTFEKEFGDLASGNRFQQFNGCRINGMTLAVTHGDLVTGTFAVAGRDIERAATSAVGSGSESAQDTAKRIMSAAQAFTNWEIDGSSDDSELMSISIEANNNMEPTYALGSLAPGNQVKGDGVFTGTAQLYMSVAGLALYERALDNTLTDISFRLTEPDSSDYYQFDFPVCVLTGVTPRSQGRNQRVMVDIEFEAIRTASTVTRSIS